MPNQRAEDQTLIAFALRGELLRGLDQARETKQHAGKNRSAFVRDAIKAELDRLGIRVSAASTLAPDRAKAKRYPEHRPDHHELNASSGATGGEKAFLKKAVDGVRNPAVVYRRSRKAASTSGKTS